MDQNAKCVSVTSSGKKIPVEQSPVGLIRGNRKAEQKDSRRRISCKDLGNGEYEGWLWSKKEKPGFGPNIWRKYWFMLKEKSLYCYKDPQDVVARRLYHLPAFVISVARETSKKHAFKISHSSFGTVLFATKDYADMSKWMTHMILSCAEEPDACRRKRSDESTGDISESDNEEENTDEEEKTSLHPVTENENETEDKDSTSATPTTVFSSDSALSSSAAEFETESMPIASSHQGPTPLESSAPESHLLTSSNSKSDPVRSSIAESTSSSSSKDESSSSSSSKDESTPLAASEQSRPQLLCHQPKSNSVNIASPEPESTTHTSEVFEPALAAKKACGPATLSKPKPSLNKSPLTSPMSPLTSLKSSLSSPMSPLTSPMSPLTSPKSPWTSSKSPPSGDSSVSPVPEGSSLTKPTLGPPATFVKPLRPIPSMGRQSSTTDMPATSSTTFALAKLAFETASSSKPSPSTTVVTPGKLPKTSDAAKGSAKTPSEVPTQGSSSTTTTTTTTTTTGPGICTKLSSTNNAINTTGETSAVVSVSSLPGKAITEPVAVSATPASSSAAAAAAAAASSAKALLVTEHLSTQSIASGIDTRNVRPASFARISASPRAVSETLPPNWTLSGQALSSNTTDSAARAMSASYGDKTLPSSEARSNFVKSQSVESGETRLSTVTSLSGNEEKVVDIPPALQNSENLSPLSGHVSEASKDEMEDTFQSGEPLPELSANKRALTRMTFIAKSIKLKTVPSPANRLQARLLTLQRSLKDKLQELQSLEELLKTPVMTSDKLIQFRRENRDLAKRLNGNSMDLDESFDSDMDNYLEGATCL